jgi:hypothetical protein
MIKHGSKFWFCWVKKMSHEKHPTLPRARQEQAQRSRLGNSPSISIKSVTNTIMMIARGFLSWYYHHHHHRDNHRDNHDVHYKRYNVYHYQQHHCPLQSP